MAAPANVLRVVGSNPDGTLICKIISGFTGGGPGSAAVVFDGGNPANVRTDRTDGTEEAIDNSKSGIVSLGSNQILSPLRGCRADYAAILSGTQCAVWGDAGAVAGGQDNWIGIGANGAACPGGGINLLLGPLCHAAGGLNVAVGAGTSCMGYGSTAFGAFSNADGFACHASGQTSRACGVQSITGFEPRAFDLPGGAGTVTVRIPGDVTDEFFNGDAVVIKADGDGYVTQGPRSSLGQNIVTPPVFAAGFTTFDITGAIDPVSTTGVIADTDIGVAAFASGSARAVDNGCFAHGYPDAIKTTARGEYSCAIGLRSGSLRRGGMSWGEDCIVAAVRGTAGGAACRVFGDESLCVGDSNQANAERSAALGTGCRTGQPAYDFTVSAGGTLVTIPDGIDHTAEFSAADLLNLWADGGTLRLGAQVQIDGGGSSYAVNTTFNLTARIDANSTFGALANVTTSAPATGALAVGTGCIATSNGVSAGQSCQVRASGSFALGVFCKTDGGASIATGLNGYTALQGERAHASSSDPFATGGDGPSQMREIVLSGAAVGALSTVDLFCDGGELLLRSGFSYYVTVELLARKGAAASAAAMFGASYECVVDNLVGTTTICGEGQVSPGVGTLAVSLDFQDVAADGAPANTLRLRCTNVAGGTVWFTAKVTLVEEVTPVP